MGLILKGLIALFGFIKILSLILSLVYLVIWCIEIYFSDLFLKINHYFGFLPNALDNLVYIEADIAGGSVSMGYVYAAIVMVGVYFLCIKLINKFDIVFRNEENKTINKKLDKERKLKEKQELEQKKKMPKVKSFYSLIELKLNYVDIYKKNEIDLKTLKNEYSKMLVNKLKKKYANVKFIISDKIFLICNDISAFEHIVADVIKLYKVFMALNKEKSIETNLLFANWTKAGQIVADEACKILVKINNLNFLNKVVINEGIYSYFQNQKKHFDFVSLGSSKLMDSKNKDIDVELYYLLYSSFAKRDDE